MTETVDILNNIIDACKLAVVESLQDNGRYATGQTVQELQEVVSDMSAFLLAPWWIDALENGRKPTPPGTPEGDPTLVEAIKPWLAVKGIPESAAYAIAKNIHKYGYPGKPGVLSIPLGDDSINNLLKNGMEDIAANQQKEVAELFNALDGV